MEALLKHTIPSLVSEGVFGDYDFVGLKKDDGAEIDPQFSSELISLNLELRSQSGDKRIIPLVIKVQQKETGGRDFETLFYNEVIMYRDILPFLNEQKVRRYPKMFYGNATLGEDLSKDIVIMENLKVYGYELCRQKVALDYEHISVAMKAIGELHAWSYNLKAKDSKAFHEMANKLKPCKFVEQEPELDGASMRRGIKLCLALGKEVDVLNKYMETIQVTKTFLDFVHGPTEPFAVILHGDYCKNNMQFKYDENGVPTDCAYFDFQTSKYGSPVVDLAFFLYMHTTAESRQHWEEYLEIYWRSVRDNVTEEVKLPTFEDFLQYFSTKAVLGYFPCSFYLPMMMVNPEDLIPFEVFVKLPLEEKLNLCENFGGEECGYAVRDIVSHLMEKKYVHSFLEYYEKVKPY